MHLYLLAHKSSCDEVVSSGIEEQRQAFEELHGAGGLFI